MSTITAILELDADGSLHLPVPAEMKRGKIKVTATLTPVAEMESVSDLAVQKRGQAVAALQRIAARGGLQGMDNPVDWQKEMREDRSLPGRTD